MYKSLEDLMAGIYEMAAPDGIICNEVSKFGTVANSRW